MEFGLEEMLGEIVGGVGGVRAVGALEGLDSAVDARMASHVGGIGRGVFAIWAFQLLPGLLGVDLLVPLEGFPGLPLVAATAAVMLLFSAVRPEVPLDLPSASPCELTALLGAHEAPAGHLLAMDMEVLLQQGSVGRVEIEFSHP